MSASKKDYYIHEPERVKELLRMYPQLKALLLNTQEELKRIIAEEENFISDDLILEALELSSREFSDMPFSPTRPSPGNKETNIIATYEKSKKNMEQQIKQELAEEIIRLREVVRKIEHSYNSLSRDHKIIIHGKYYLDLTWEEIALKIHLSKSPTIMQHGRALQQIMLVIRMPRSSYEWCRKKLNLDGWRVKKEVKKSGK